MHVSHRALPLRNKTLLDGVCAGFPAKRYPISLVNLRCSYCFPIFPNFVFPDFSCCTRKKSENSASFRRLLHFFSLLGNLGQAQTVKNATQCNKQSKIKPGTV
ncbi:unnamed protein product [Ectocarpus sp. 8 AP-2014]